MKKKGKWLVTLLLVVAAGGGVWWWRNRPGAAPPVTAQIVTATRGNLVVLVSATGAVEPEYTVEIKSKASGTVAAVNVVAGDQVEKGTLLLAIDPVVERRKLTQAQAELAMAQAQRGNTASKLDHARAQLARDQTLLDKGLVSRDTVDVERKEVAVLQGEAQVNNAQLTRARAAYDEAKDRLTETKIFAPISGTILDRTVNPGQVITAGTAQGGQTLLTLADLTRLFVRVKVDEADVTKVAPGQSVRVTADALPGQVFRGSVLRVAPQGKVESNVTVFEVVVEIGEDGRARLRPMITANVEIRVGEAKGVVLVPRRALQQREGKAVVIVEGGRAQPVEVGLADDRQIEIRSGLGEGARVLVAGARRSQPKTGAGAGRVGGGLGGVGGVGGGRPR